MTVSKQLTMLEVAYDLIARVHSDICNGEMSKRDLADDTLEILKKIAVFNRKLGRSGTE